MLEVRWGGGGEALAPFVHMHQMQQQQSANVSKASFDGDDDVFKKFRRLKESRSFCGSKTASRSEGEVK